MPKAKHFFSETEKTSIVEAIAAAEKGTSSEIRVRLEDRCFRSPEKRAQVVFRKLKMHSTQERNGLLIYLAIKNKRFALFADKGFEGKMDKSFLTGLSTNMEQHFKAGDFLKGIISTVEAAGKDLAKMFPAKKDDKNELPDEISFE